MAVHAFNQRSVGEILDMIRMLGAIVGVPDDADRLAGEFADHLAAVRREASHASRRQLKRRRQP